MQAIENKAFDRRENHYKIDRSIRNVPKVQTSKSSRQKDENGWLSGTVRRLKRQFFDFNLFGKDTTTEEAATTTSEPSGQQFVDDNETVNISLRTKCSLNRIFNLGTREFRR